MIDSSSYEDDLNILLDKLSKTISTFNTLSREQAEIAILDTTSKIKDGESILSKLEEELKNNTNNHSPEELIEERKKLKNYKTEFNNIVNKFNIIQNNYINELSDKLQTTRDELSNQRQTSVLTNAINNQTSEILNAQGRYYLNPPCYQGCGSCCNGLY